MGTEELQNLQGAEGTPESAPKEPQSAEEKEGQKVLLRGLPPELKDLEGKDLESAVAEIAKLKKSYDEAQSFIGRQAYELGILRQMVQRAQQASWPMANMPMQPMPQFQQQEKEEFESFDDLVNAVKTIKQENERLKAYLSAYDVKNAVLSKFPDAHEYANEINVIVRNVDPVYLNDPRTWYVAYQMAKFAREAVKTFGQPEQEAFIPPQEKRIQEEKKPAEPEPVKANVAGDAGNIVAKGKGRRGPLPPNINIKRISKLVGIPAEELERQLTSEEE